MEALKVTAHIDKKGRLQLDVPTALPEGKVELILVLQEAPGKAYRFGDLVGTLTWQGDALEIQRRLRDEW